MDHQNSLATKSQPGSIIVKDRESVLGQCFQILPNGFHGRLVGFLGGGGCGHSTEDSGQFKIDTGSRKGRPWWRSLSLKLLGRETLGHGDEIAVSRGIEQTKGWNF